MNTLLVPVDFSDVSAKVAATAAALAAALGSRVILLHVAQPEPQFGGYDPGPLSVRVAVAGDMHGDRLRLEGMKAIFGGTEVLALQVQGATAEKILSMAREHGAGMIVMGSHGHGALYHLVSGSVTTAVLKEARCPVLVVPYGREGGSGKSSA